MLRRPLSALDDILSRVIASASDDATSRILRMTPGFGNSQELLRGRFKQYHLITTDGRAARACRELYAILFIVIRLYANLFPTRIVYRLRSFHRRRRSGPAKSTAFITGLPPQESTRAATSPPMLPRRWPLQRTPTAGTPGIEYHFLVTAN